LTDGYSAVYFVTIFHQHIHKGLPLARALKWQHSIPVGSFCQQNFSVTAREPAASKIE